MEAEDSFFDEHLSDYSDDFEDDVSSGVNQRPPPLALDFQSTPRRVQQDSSFSVKTNRTDPIFRKAKSQYMSGRKGSKLNRTSVKGKGRAASEMMATSKAVKQGGMFSPRDRELSAKRHTIKKLENSLTEVKRELIDLKKENRLLNRLQVRQEKEIDRFQTQEGELPEILARHSEEVRVLKEQLKRSQEASHSHQQKANDLRQELLRVNNRKKKLEEVAKRKHLLEREKLTLQLQDTNEQLMTRERRISELERGVEAMNKNHGQEVRSWMLKTKALSKENEDLRNTSKILNAQLKEKEREMDVLNIYSQRLGKNMPQRIATRLQAPITESIGSQTELTCPPAKNVSLQTKHGLKTSSSQTDFPLAKPPISVVTVTTQTDIVASPKNDNLEASNTHQNAVKVTTIQQPISKPAEAVERVMKVPTPESMKVPTPPKPVDPDLEEQKKRELLATLKAMDAQRDPPASQPIATASTTVKSTAQPTSNVPVGVGERLLAGKMTKQSPAPLPQQPKANESDEEEAIKKKLLLAKLMAIDEGGDPNKVTMSKMDVSKGRPSPKHSASTNKSTTSIQSWPETVENMYNGKPAFATEEDPFGSRHHSTKSESLSKSKDFFITETGRDSPKTKRSTGRRHQLEQKNSSDFNSDISVGRSSKVVNKAAMEQQKGSPPAEAPDHVGYQPTFGRRAGAGGGVQGRQKPKNGMIFGDFNLAEPTVKKAGPPPSSLPVKSGADDEEKQETDNRDYPWETRVNVSSNPQGIGREEEKTERERRKNNGGPLSSPSMVFGYVGQQKPLLQSRSRGSLLPLREKVNAPTVMPATVDVTEPDDLEEFAL